MKNTNQISIINNNGLYTIFNNFAIINFNFLIWLRQLLSQQ